MSESLRPLTRPRLYEQVVERLREYVTTEGLKAGDRLPPERDLADRLGVSRTSVRQAIVALEVQGLVEVRHGGGTYLLRDRLNAEPLETMIDRRRRLPDVLDARDALETKLAALAAVRRTEQDLVEIDAALAAMADAVDRGELGVDEDQRFHAAVTTAAHSALLADFMAEISLSIAESRTESLRQPGRPARSLEQHRRVAEAIRAGDSEEAARAMHTHIDTVGRVKLLDWQSGGES
ncbi:FadR/GntR family transcriptional regulator [Streptomyces sp. Ru72]|uniref:FadR/GntR family transcriptional regulator n=1 Tax=Streptomyces sp. Ru72 TaxID=2080747 RepID=UPI000CDD335D|nr:FadR/GntR family transcriptional regulator [Streptomyces sp. Ru72]POX47208.1 GntR family transcriptional regulator [Streptomyces sp. Ru72]